MFYHYPYFIDEETQTESSEVSLLGTHSSQVVDFGFSLWAARFQNSNHCSTIRCMLDSHRDHILTLTGRSGAFRRALALSFSTGRGLGLRLRLEKRRESRSEDPSHPGLASFISVTNFRGVEWGGRKRKGNCLPKLPFPSSWLGLVQSNLPQMARAFNVHRVEVA